MLPVQWSEHLGPGSVLNGLVAGLSVVPIIAGSVTLAAAVQPNKKYGHATSKVCKSPDETGNTTPTPLAVKIGDMVGVKG